MSVVSDVGSLNRKEQREKPYPPRSRDANKRTPQENVSRFWKRFHTKHPGGVSAILPENPHAKKKTSKASEAAAQAQRAVRSYEQAREECQRDVNRIIRECRRVNERYRDAHFDIESDLKERNRDCLEGLAKSEEYYRPKATKRVTDIFENPKFFVQGASAGDVMQGAVGDCYLMAALCGIGGMACLIDRICIARDQEVGVYGFVFYRDGEWQQCIIDDQLYLTAPDYDEAVTERDVWDSISRSDTEEEYRRTHQTGSRALYFAKCSDPNETWLPLLEKAYAKAHGDFDAICGGFTGDAIEDLTGGVTSTLKTRDILDKNVLWTTELLRVGDDFLFGCATGYNADWLEPGQHTSERQGIVENHAYSIIQAVEHTVDDKLYRLVKVRNPWGRKAGWSGAWSDGSAEWTPEWMKRLEHKFGDNGIFWISFEDLMKKYEELDRTRIFDSKWSINQQWTSVQVPRSADYHQTRFSITVSRTTPAVIVLSQLDGKYFRGLDGQYGFKLQFRVHKVGDEEDYIVRSSRYTYATRSVNTDITLEPGSYFVLMKITAEYKGGPPLDTLVASHAMDRPEKLLQVGLSYDVAHAKATIVEPEKQAGTKTKTVKREEIENPIKSVEDQCRSDRISASREHTDNDRAAAGLQAEGTADQSGTEATHEATLASREDSFTSNGPTPPGDGRSLIGEIIASREHPSATTTPDISVTESKMHLPSGDSNVQPSRDEDKDPGPIKAEACPPQLASPSIPEVQVTSVEAELDGKLAKKRPDPLKNEAAADSTSGKQDGMPADNQEGADLSANTEAADGLGLDNNSTIPASYHGTDLSRGGATENLPTATNQDDYDYDYDDQELGPDFFPWNAVCVVGLRVYSQDPKVSLQVVRPDQHAEREGVKAEWGGVGAAQTLDPDDPAKGAVTERWAKTPVRDLFGPESG